LLLVGRHGATHHPAAAAVEGAVVADSGVGQIHDSAAVPDSERALLAGIVAQIAGVVVQIAGVVWLEGDWAASATMER
jgi:hypothetical protein